MRTGQVVVDPPDVLFRPPCVLQQQLFSKTCKSIALSSAESEFGAAVAAAIDGILAGHVSEGAQRCEV